MYGNFIGDVRDQNRLKRAMQGVDIVRACRSSETRSACEYNPMEAVETNIGGAERSGSCASTQK